MSWNSAAVILNNIMCIVYTINLPLQSLLIVFVHCWFKQYCSFLLRLLSKTKNYVHSQRDYWLHIVLFTIKTNTAITLYIGIIITYIRILLLFVIFITIIYNRNIIIYNYNLQSIQNFTGHLTSLIRAWCRTKLFWWTHMDVNC